MPIQILMPALSPTMTEGNVASWLKSEGDQVAAGDILCEIETDKATMEVEATDEGTLGRIVVPAGTEGVAVNAVIGLILEEGEDASALDGVEIATPAVAAPAAAPAEPAVESAPAASAAPAPQATAPVAPSPGGNGATPPAPAREPGARIFASPLARRMAKQAGLALEAIAGTGPNGRIVKADIEAAIAAAAAAPAAAVAASAAAAAPAAVPAHAPAAYRDAPASTMRKVIAQRLQEAKREVPHFYLTVDCAVDALLETRPQLNERSDAYNLSVNDFVIRAAALALRKVPGRQRVLGGRRAPPIRERRYLGGGRDRRWAGDAHRAQRGRQGTGRDLSRGEGACRARPGQADGSCAGGVPGRHLQRLQPRQCTASRNSRRSSIRPQSMILAVGTAEQRPVVKDGALAVATMMTCTLSVDHRVVDGALGATFLQAFKGLIEDPLTMLL